MATVLDKIVAQKRLDIDQAKQRVSRQALEHALSTAAERTEAWDADDEKW